MCIKTNRINSAALTRGGNVALLEPFVRRLGKSGVSASCLQIDRISRRSGVTACDRLMDDGTPCLSTHTGHAHQRRKGEGGVDVVMRTVFINSERQVRLSPRKES